MKGRSGARGPSEPVKPAVRKSQWSGGAEPVPAEISWGGRGEKNYRAEERRVLAESIESAKINVSVFKGFYKYAIIKCNLGGRVNLPRCREIEFGEYLYFTFFFVAIMF